MAYTVDCDGVERIGNETIDEYMVSSRQGIEDQARRTLERIPRTMESIRQCFEACGKLWAAEIPFKCWGHDSIYIDCDLKDLPKIHKAIGRIKLYNKDIKDEKKRIVQVTLMSEKYPILRVCYTKKLPRPKKGEEAKCKIVKSRYTSARLVCSI